MKKKLFAIIAVVGVLLTSCNGEMSETTEEAPHEIKLSTALVNMECEPDTYSILVTSPCSWKAVTDNDWINIETVSGIAGTETLVFGVERNTKEEVRKGTIVISNTSYNLVSELYVTQKAFSSQIIIEPKTLNFTNEGGSQTIEISSNFDYEVTVSENWVTYKKIDNGLVVTVPLYSEIEDRTTEIVISNKQYDIEKIITITQTAFVPEISVEFGVLNFPAEGGEREVRISANFNYSAESYICSWCSCTMTTNGIYVTVDPSEEPDKRTCVLNIYDDYDINKEIIITQDTNGPIIEFKKTSPIEFGFDSGRLHMSDLITTNLYDYQVTTSDRWVQYLDWKSELYIEYNSEPKPRTAEVTISSEQYNISKTLTITQEANPIGRMITYNGVKGVIFYQDDKITKIVSVTETSCQWSTEFVKTYSASSDGKYNMQKIQSIEDWETKYPAFKWCADYGKGWYLPSENEFLEIMSPEPPGSYLGANYLENLNITLVENGYDKIVGTYWTSTESYDRNAMSAEVNGSASQPKSDVKKVRAICTFEH